VTGRLVGLVLLAAAALKALDPVQTVLGVGAYGLLPPALALAAGLLLAGVEAAAGAALLTGFLARGGALVAAGLALSFLAFTGWAAWRGLDTACGCFGPLSGLPRGWTALLDALLLAGALATWRRLRSPPGDAA